MFVSTAHAGSTDLTGLKLPCATFKTDKLIQKTTCTVLNGIELGNVFGAGVDMVLKPAKARQSVHITHHIQNKTHPDGSVMYDDDDNLVIAEVKSTLNDMPAISRYRHSRTLNITSDNRSEKLTQIYSWLNLVFSFLLHSLLPLLLNLGLT